MKKILLTTVMLLSMCLGISAQETVGDMAIWAALVDANGQQIDCTGYTLEVGTLGDMIGSAEGKTTYVGNTAVSRFELMATGFADYEGQELLFALLSPDGVTQYVVTPSQKITYSDGKTYGTPSQPITFKFVKPTSISASGEIHVNVGESVKLGQYLNVAPAGANIPILEWQIVPITQESISIDYESTDDIATGNAKLTGQFPAASPLRVRPYISGAEGITFSNTKYLRVYVDQPIESLELTEDYADGVITLYADQQTPLTLLGTQLRTILNSCYSVNPSTATETPVWTSGNEEIIANDGQGNWNILTTGECVMTLTAANGATVSVTVKIIRRVDGINVYDGTLHLVVGDDISCFHQAYEVFPVNATNKSVTIDVITNSQVFLIDPISNVALAPGEGKFKITSNDNPQYVSFVPFIIEPKYEINVPAQPLAFTTEDDDITDRVLDKVSITNRSARYAMWTSNNNNVVSINMNEEIPELMDITVNGEGSATITVTVNQHRTVITGPGINGLSNVEVPVSKSFVINVTTGLTGLQFDDIQTEVDEWVTFTVTPVPADANYDYSDIDIYFVDDATGEVDTEYDKVSLWGGYENSYTVVPNEPLKGKLVAYYKGVSLGETGSAKFNAGQGFTPVEGWDWISTYVGNVDDIYSLYGDNLIEARSQTSMIYNDPVYGYFGSLTDFTKLVGYKVKNAEDGERTIVPCDGTYNADAETTITLHHGYNWIGSPYATSRWKSPDVVFESSAEEGDMIISQNDGFSEFADQYWQGLIEGLEPGKGYIYYNAGPEKTVTMPAESYYYQFDDLAAKSLAKSKVADDDAWQYNSRAFANNMPVIARIDGLANADYYTVGAFVGNECRGRGSMVNGKFFITVHGEKGEDVHFMLHNTLTGEFFAVDGNVRMASRAGSLAEPVALSANMTVTGINAAEVSKSMKGVNYNIAGQRVGDNAKGIVISKGYKAVKVVKK